MPRAVGTRFESSLHKELKRRYAGKGGRTEAEVAGFIADGITARGDFIEIQTGSFGPLKKKAKEFARLGKVRIIYPVIVAKYIEGFDIDGNRKYRRKSPRKGSPWDIFDVLVYAPELPLIRGLTVELALVDALEIRVWDGKGSWRRKGASIIDRKMITFHKRITLKEPSDYLRFIPFTKSEEFTSYLLGEKAGIDTHTARKVLYVLTRLGVIEKIGKRRNALVYRRKSAIFSKKPNTTT